MKKISFKDLESSKTARKLDLEQMKNLRGGYYDWWWLLDPGTCGYKGPSAPEPICGITKEAAVYLYNELKGYYCCDSCKSNGGPASYC